MTLIVQQTHGVIGIQLKSKRIIAIRRDKVLCRYLSHLESSLSTLLGTLDSQSSAERLRNGPG